MPVTPAAHRTTSRVLFVAFLFVFLTSVISPRAALATEPETTPTQEASPSSEPSAPPASPPETSPSSEPSSDPSSAPSSAPIGAPTITSDKDDYAPGELVTLTGSNWQPGELVEIRVNDDQGMTWNRISEVVADESGNIVDQFNLPSWFVAVYSVTAVGSLSGVATTSFTDARVVLSATLNGGTSVSVPAGASITAVLNVQTDGTGANARWRSSSWAISTTAPSTVSAGSCVDHTNHDGAGTFSETITISAPSTPGTYNAYFKAHADETCGGAGGGASALFVLTNGVTVTPADTTRPTVTLTSAAPNPTNTSPIPVTAQFSENVVNFVAGDITAGNATVANFVAVDGANYTFNLVPTGQGTVTASIAENVANDAAGNGNTAATQLSRVYDSVRPSLTLTSAAANPTNTSPIPVTAQFSETVSGFVATNIVATNATVAAFTAVDGDTYTFNLVPASQGTVTANVAQNVAIDAAGNGNTAAAELSRVYDTSAPTVTITTSSTLAGTGWYNRASSGTTGITVDISASDTTGIASLSCTRTGSPVSGLGLAGGSVIVGDGTHAFSCSATDNAGNTAGASATFQVDQTNPAVTVIPDRAPNGAGWYNAPVTFDTNGTDVTSGIASCSADQVYSAPDGTGLTVSGSCTDNAGNSTNASSAAFKYDATAPAVTVIPDRAPNGAGWYNAPVTFDTNGTDVTSGIASCSADQVYSAPDGTGLTVSGSCTDNAGNSTNASSAAFKYDATDPELTISLAPASPDGENNWYVSDVTVTLSATDATSGIAAGSLEYSLDGGTTWTTYTTPFTISADGHHSVDAQVSDDAGNDDSESRSFKIDQTAPVASASRTPGANTFGWNNTNVTVSFSAADNLSGVADCDADVVVSSEGAAQSASGTCRDQAGNVSNITSVTGINIDKTAPLAYASRTPAGNAYGWNKTDVTVSFSGTDALSGVASCAANVTLASEGANQSASGTCTDEAGNESLVATASNIHIDKTAPELTCIPAEFDLNEPGATVSANVSDGLSGAVDGTVSGSASTSAVGSFSVSLTGEDKAGNSTTVSCAYTVGYVFTGLSAPVNKPNTMNVSKAGQAIPLKWRITDYNGVGITTLTSVGVTVTGLSCGTGTTTDQIEEYASGNSGLLNLGDGYYQFNWKTPTSYANSCKTLSIKLGSAPDAPKMENLALFSFKK